VGSYAFAGASTAGVATTGGTTGVSTAGVAGAAAGFGVSEAIVIFVMGFILCLSVAAAPHGAGLNARANGQRLRERQSPSLSSNRQPCMMVDQSIGLRALQFKENVRRK
jgi:hypothetical protein